MDEADTTAPAEVDDVASAVQLTGTVDFDVFGDAPEPQAQDTDKEPNDDPQKKQPH